MPTKRATIIVAGGKGLRMQTDIPKQFVEIQGKPILMHTIEIFYNFDNFMDLILVIPAHHFDYWNELCKKHNFYIQHSIVAGGDTRFESVRNGLKLVEVNSVVAIHDGVRPLVSHATIERCFQSAELTGAAIPVTDCMESIRRQSGLSSVSEDRNQFKLVQTPQVFETDILKAAYKQTYSTLFTDDASVVESYFAAQNLTAQNQITLVEGNRENIKITTKFDLIIADVLLKNDC